MSSTRDVVAIPGDGIGPKVMNAAQAVLHAAGAHLKWHDHHADTEGLREMREGAERINTAYNRALETGHTTHDPGGDLGTTAFTKALLQEI